VDTLRALLIQRAARLQEWPALTAPGWGTLRYPALRNRVEGVALGLMADSPPLGAPFRSTLTPGAAGAWTWAAEVACACCGLTWDPDGAEVGPALLGGLRFNDEGGRQAYHDRDHSLTPDVAFHRGLDHAELLRRLRRLNGTLGWDQTTELVLPLDELGQPGVRGALWSALYAGSHAILREGAVKGWEPGPFLALFAD
jgi:hypothetical protein